MNQSVAIIIVNWNSYDDTSKCLESLKSLDYGFYAVFLVDNGSEDGSGDRLKSEFPEITLLKSDVNEGFTGGNNRGLREALRNNYDYLLLLNNDTIVTSEFLGILVNSFDDEKVGAVQPKIMYNADRGIIWNAGTRYNSLFCFPYTRGVNRQDRGQFESQKFIPWITGCCFLIKSTVAQEVGLLDDRFFIYYEDADWSFRIRNAGYSLKYIPEAKIYHSVGRSQSKRSSEGEGKISPFSHYITVRNGIILMRKHSNWLTFLSGSLYQIIKLIAYIVYFTIKSRPKKRAATFRGFKEGYLTSLA